MEQGISYRVEELKSDLKKNFEEFQNSQMKGDRVNNFLKQPYDKKLRFQSSMVNRSNSIKKNINYPGERLKSMVPAQKFNPQVQVLQNGVGVGAGVRFARMEEEEKRVDNGDDQNMGVAVDAYNDPRVGNVLRREVGARNIVRYFILRNF